MLVSVGSKNKVKIEAVNDALKEIGISAQIISVEVDPQVPNQPYCEETFAGARRRAILSLAQTASDLGIGIEGGLCVAQNRILAFAVVHAVDKEGNENFSISSAFTLPPSIVKELNNGVELGYAVDKVFSKSGSKYNEGAVGILTGIIDRKRLYVEPVILALYPFYRTNIP
ncbi:MULTISPECIES: DUF84 family protein [Acidianus]|uniref:Probable inosine/xanthosine triphosphatase n=1 Tax=Candidatus Acidianus copahuensis TaxID=1160895 RepID=A0A031LJY1_9CREN|nr:MULTISPECIES: inosine/xanthosine triphosphatase [Acidianus]EZQ01826.1 purine NTP phosphatase [Candidatus Acidianus copahuensis]NON63606.1 DUF84 family protein [Acidianus sp. RZ1]